MRHRRKPIGGSNPPLSASYYVLDIAYIIVFLGSLFSREFAGVTGLVSKAIRGRDGCTRDFGCGRYENLSGAISWLTFFAGGSADVRRSRSDWRRELAEPTKAEELSLFSPAGRQARRQTHQCLGGELRRFSAIDDGRGDVGRQPGKTQEGIEVGCRHLLFASDIMHAQLGVLVQTRLDVVSARAMILSKLGSAGVWSSAFSTSIRISRPARFRPTGTVNPRKSSGALVGACI